MSQTHFSVESFHEKNHSQHKELKMKGLKKTQVIYIILLLAALLLTHINVLELVMGSESYVLYSVQETLKSEAFHFEARFTEADEMLPIYVRGNKNKDVIDLSIMSDMALLFQLEYNTTSGEMVIEEGMLEFPQELLGDAFITDVLGGLSISESELKKVFSTLEIEKSASHQVVNENIRNSYTINHTHEIAVDYRARVKQVNTTFHLGDSEMGVEITLSSD